MLNLLYLLKNKNKNYLLLFLSIALVLLGHLFINYESLLVGGYSRLVTLKQILAMGQKGFYYQIGELVPMDIIWEDPMMGFLLSTVQLIGDKSGLWSTNIFIIYYIQFLLIIFIFFLPFSKKIFSIPYIILFIVPIYFLISIITSTLFYSYNNYWVGNLSIFLICSYKCSFLYLINNETINKKKIIISSLVACFVLATLSLLRRNIYFETLLILMLFSIISYSFILLRKIKLSPIYFLIPIIFFLTSYHLQDFIIKKIWDKRDKIYNIDIKDRNPTHPLWVPLYAGLGMIKNNLDIKWGDGALYWNLKKEFPEFEIDKYYGKKEYELKTKELYLKTIKNNPELFINSILKKTIIIVKKHYPIVFVLLVLIAISLSIKKYIIFGISSIATLLSTSTVPILTSIFYVTTFRSALIFWNIFFILLFINEIVLNKNFIMKSQLGIMMVNFFSFVSKQIIALNSLIKFSYLKKLIIKFAFIILVLIIALYSIFNLFEKKNFVIIDNSNLNFKLSWTTEKDKFFDNTKSITREIEINPEFKEYEFKINNAENDLKYLKFNIISKYPVNIYIKDILLFDGNKNC